MQTSRPALTPTRLITHHMFIINALLNQFLNRFVPLITGMSINVINSVRYLISIQLQFPTRSTLDFPDAHEKLSYYKVQVRPTKFFPCHIQSKLSHLLVLFNQVPTCIIKDINKQWNHCFYCLPSNRSRLSKHRRSRSQTII